MLKVTLKELMDVAHEGYLFDSTDTPSSSAILIMRGPAGESLLHVASARGSLLEIDFLLKIGLEINAKADYGATPLHYAAMTQQREAYDYLIVCGADASIRDSSGFLASDYLD